MILKFWFYWIISDDQSHMMMVLGSVAHLKVRDWEDYQESTYFFSNHSFNFHLCLQIVLKRYLGLHELVFEEYVPPDRAKVSYYSNKIINKPITNKKKKKRLSIS
jgi:hypothetical protein